MSVDKILDKILAGQLKNWRFLVFVVPLFTLWVVCVMALIFGKLAKGIGDGVIYIVNEINFSEKLKLLVKWIEDGKR